ncbi:hypothetical protein C3K47_01115 [Solitalea longa]|uniref:Uncharacterized protein n=1 Tax=Solitalea longa TaxID=2079460 RepID=A0A2S5AA62_9SPHI|nr:hypothetical protein [Solitalea longa]POY39127.1 hypothetical protein C3K47_01115 [Solitalea longa]
MKAASINELKKELQAIQPSQLIELCLRIAKYKKENKELLSYLLFEAENESAYVESVKNLIDEQFEELPRLNTYLATKAIRKILRMAKKYIKYSGLKQTEVELLIYFCRKLKTSKLKIHSSTALTNLYQQQLKLINKALDKLHEDLQLDFQQELNELY